MQIRKLKLRNQRGISFLEVMAILAVMSYAGYATMQKLGSEAVAKSSDNAAVAAINIQNAARMYRNEHGSWPTTTTQLVNAGLLTSNQAISPFNTAYSFSVSGNQLVITNTATNANYARRVSGLLPSGSASGSTYSFRFLPPGSEASVQSVYSLDGSKALTGSMNAGGHNISSVGTLTANTINSNQFNTGTLNATGRVTGGEIYTSGVVNAGSVLTNGQIRGGSLIISGTAATGNLNVTGDVNATGNMIARGNLEAIGSVKGSHLQSAGTLDVDGNANIDGTLRVGGVLNAVSGIYTGSIIDPNNAAYSIRPAGNSTLNELTATGDFNLTQNKTIGTICTSGGISFNSSSELMVCKNGVWTLASSAGSIEYLTEEESSYNFGGLIIKAGKRRVGEGRKTFYLSNPFPSISGHLIICSATYDAYSASNSAASCSGTFNQIIIDNGSSSTKTMHWIAIGFKR